MKRVQVTVKTGSEKMLDGNTEINVRKNNIVENELSCA